MYTRTSTKIHTNDNQAHSDLIGNVFQNVMNVAYFFSAEFYLVVSPPVHEGFFLCPNRTGSDTRERGNSGRNAPSLKTREERKKQVKWTSRFKRAPSNISWRRRSSIRCKRPAEVGHTRGGESCLCALQLHTIIYKCGCKHGYLTHKRRISHESLTRHLLVCPLTPFKFSFLLLYNSKLKVTHVQHTQKHPFQTGFTVISFKTCLISRKASLYRHSFSDNCRFLFKVEALGGLAKKRKKTGASRVNLHTHTRCAHTRTVGKAWDHNKNICPRNETFRWQQCDAGKEGAVKSSTSWQWRPARKASTYTQEERWGNSVTFCAPIPSASTNQSLFALKDVCGTDSGTTECVHILICVTTREMIDKFCTWRMGRERGLSYDSLCAFAHPLHLFELIDNKFHDCGFGWAP